MRLYHVPAMSQYYDLWYYLRKEAIVHAGNRKSCLELLSYNTDFSLSLRVSALGGKAKGKKGCEASRSWSRIPFRYSKAQPIVGLHIAIKPERMY